MEAARSLYVDVFDVERRLKFLGLTQAVLLDAVRAGFLARSQCTELDPPCIRDRPCGRLRCGGFGKDLRSLAGSPATTVNTAWPYPQMIR